MGIPDASLSLADARARPAVGPRAGGPRAGSAGSAIRLAANSPAAEPARTHPRSTRFPGRTGGRSGPAPDSARSCKAGRSPRSPPRPRPPRDWTTGSDRGIKDGVALLVNAAIQKARGFAINKTRAFAFLGDGTAYRQGKKIGTRRAHARACGRCGNPQTDSHDLPHGLLLLDSPEPWRTIPGATGAIQQIRAGFNPHQRSA